MLELYIPKREETYFDEGTEEFVMIKTDDVNLVLEHSLLSLKKWEQFYQKPFLKRDKTEEEMRYYVKCMTICPKLPDDFYETIQNEYMAKIAEYIENPMTATWFREDNGLIGMQRNSRQTVTAELIYYWMIEMGIPVEFEKWHLNQLLTLIKVIGLEREHQNKDKKKIDRVAEARERDRLNEERKRRLNTRG